MTRQLRHYHANKDDINRRRRERYRQTKINKQRPLFDIDEEAPRECPRTQRQQSNDSETNPPLFLDDEHIEAIGEAVKRKILDFPMSSESRERIRKARKVSFDCLGVLGQICLLVLTGALATFLVVQTSPLYESMSDPYSVLSSIAMVAAMIVSGWLATRGNTWAKRLGIFALLYELGLVLVGTYRNETDLAQTALLGVESVLYAKEDMIRAKAELDRYESRYNDTADKMYKNGWYNRNFVQPALTKYKETREVYSQSIAVEASSDMCWFWIQFATKGAFRLGMLGLLFLLVREMARTKEPEIRLA